MTRPTLYIVGGPNGAGKTTFAKSFLRAHAVEYLSADLIAWELSPHDVTAVQVEAAREFLLRLANCLKEKRSCLVESTLSGKSLQSWITKAKSRGYAVEIQFVYVDSAVASLLRVRERVRKGGHDVPEDDVRRRFARTIRNFWTLYRPAADSWNLAYNGGEFWQVVAHGSHSTAVVLDESRFEEFIEIAEHDAEASNG